MSMRIYGKLVATFHKSSNGGALLNRTLEVYETKSGLKGILWATPYKRWKQPQNIISIAHFRTKDNDATLYRVKEYFGGGWK